MGHALYMSRAFTDRDAIVSEADRLLRGVNFDTFVGIGISGTLIAPLLADMGKGKHGFAIVRKEMNSHSYRQIEGDIDWGTKFVFVDDLVESGRTIVRVLDAIEKEFGDDYSDPDIPRMVGAYLYQDEPNQGKFYSMEALVEKLRKDDVFYGGLRQTIARIQKTMR